MFSKTSAALIAVIIAIFTLPISVAFAADTGEGIHYLSGENLGFLWAIPFIGMLLSIALFPLFAPHFWHSHFGKVALGWALCFLIPCGFAFGINTMVYELVHITLKDYLPFLILMVALYVIASGVGVRGSIPATPIVNTSILGIGMLLASMMGTTGAAMLLIRPLIAANAKRRFNVHTIVFFIFLVANIGGALTPLGDPPLFLGFLKGVHFFWPTQHLFFPVLFVGLYLLFIFFALDSILYANEVSRGFGLKFEPNWYKQISIFGIKNLYLIGAVVAAVWVNGIWKPNIDVTILSVSLGLQSLTSMGLLAGIAVYSFQTTPNKIRTQNAFSWFPVQEVAKLFAGIFVTIIPVLAILKAADNGIAAPLIGLVTDANNEPVNMMYFWITGGLSSFLDNAPTYLVFFNVAGGSAEVQHLMTTHASTLMAISSGSVFMGACTYLGNAPNFMIRSITEERGIKMPSFFGYMVWSAIFLLPVFWLYSVEFFGGGVK